MTGVCNPGDQPKGTGHCSCNPAAARYLLQEGPGAKQWTTQFGDEMKDLFVAPCLVAGKGAVYGARFPTGIYTRGCH